MPTRQILNAGFKLLLILFSTTVFTVLTSNESHAKPECSEWSGIICEQLGATGIACGKAGVNLTARCLLTDQAPLKQFGFKFGSGTYDMNATRIDAGRYLVEIQSMSRPNDNFKKEIVLKTNADTIYPVRLASAPAGKYIWNSAIQFDMEQQLGIRPISLLKEKPRGFVDIVVVDPGKMAKAGFPGLKMNQGRLQLRYNGNNQWELNSTPRGMLVYKNATWTTSEAAIAQKPTSLSVTSNPLPSAGNLLSSSASDTSVAKQQIHFFELIAASDMSYNNLPEELLVYQSSQNSGSLYLVQNDRIGTCLIDTEHGRVYDAVSAILSADGNRMDLDIDQAKAIIPSGVDVLKGKSRYRVEAWWEQGRLAFTLGQDKENQPAAGDQDVSSSQTEEVRFIDPDLLFENSDFENGDLTNWTAVGTAFEFQPTKGDNPTSRGRGQTSNHQGEFWIGTFEKYQGASSAQLGQIQGDKPVGTIESIHFQIKEDQISFLIGGGKHPDTEYVALLVDGSEVLKATGMHNEQMRRKVWDVTAYKGSWAQIVICDQLTGGWGHVNADDFRYEGEN